MAAALISNKPEFVKLFLENGVQLKEFVTWDALLYLYENLAPSCLFHCKLQKVLAEEPEHLASVPTAPRLQMCHVAQVLRQLLGDFTQPLYPQPRHSGHPHLRLPVSAIKRNVRVRGAPPSCANRLLPALGCPLNPRSFDFIKSPLVFIRKNICSLSIKTSALQKLRWGKWSPHTCPQDCSPGASDLLV